MSTILKAFIIIVSIPIGLAIGTVLLLALIGAMA